MTCWRTFWLRAFWSRFGIQIFLLQSESACRSAQTRLPSTTPTRTAGSSWVTRFWTSPTFSAPWPNKAVQSFCLKCIQVYYIQMSYSIEDSWRFCLWLMNANGILYILVPFIPIVAPSQSVSSLFRSSVDHFNADGWTHFSDSFKCWYSLFVLKISYCNDIYNDSELFLTCFYRICFVFTLQPVCARWAPWWKEVNHDVCR